MALSSPRPGALLAPLVALVAMTLTVAISRRARAEGDDKPVAADSAATTTTSATPATTPPPEPPPEPAPEPQDPSATAALHFIERPHTIALVEAGILALPDAPISASQQGGSVPILGPIGRGDAVIQLGIHLLYRPARDWAFGAGFLFDPKPTSDTEYGGLGGLPRTHSRAYFFIGGEARWIPLHSRFVEGWVGAQAGAVIIADRFTTDTGVPKPAIFGDTEVSLSTEGFYVGGALGVDWIVSEHVFLGLVTRYSHWVLPEQPKCSPINDCTTLQGSVDSIDFGFTIGYRIAL